MRHSGTVQKRKNPLGGGFDSGITAKSNYRLDGNVRYPHLSELSNYFQPLSPIKKTFNGYPHA